MRILLAHNVVGAVRELLQVERCSTGLPGMKPRDCLINFKVKMGNPPSVTYPSPNEWLETVYPITGITKDSQATITCSAYPFASSDQFITQITFKQVEGMIPINGVTCLITNVLSSTQFQIAVNTTNFPAYTGGGVICIDTGQPPVETTGSQTFNTPWQNVL